MSQVLISLFHVECFCWIGPTNSNVRVYFQEDKSHPVYSNELMTSQLMAPCAIRRINHCVINWTVSFDDTVLNPLMNCSVCHQLKCFSWWHNPQSVDKLFCVPSTEVFRLMTQCAMRRWTVQWVINESHRVINYATVLHGDRAIVANSTHSRLLSFHQERVSCHQQPVLLHQQIE